jgi:hypothetical protein
VEPNGVLDKRFHVLLVGMVVSEVPKRQNVVSQACACVSFSKGKGNKMQRIAEEWGGYVCHIPELLFPLPTF